MPGVVRRDRGHVAHIGRQDRLRREDRVSVEGCRVGCRKTCIRDRRPEVGRLVERILSDRVEFEAVPGRVEPAEARRLSSPDQLASQFVFGDHPHARCQASLRPLPTRQGGGLRSRMGQQSAAVNIIAATFTSCCGTPLGYGCWFVCGPQGAPVATLGSVVKVRHEVADVAVLRPRRGRQHLLFCQQYPTGECPSGNRGVPSLWDNVSSSSGRAVEARADAATASINAVRDQDRMDGSTYVKPR